jgi:hypothetical protein
MSAPRFDPKLVLDLSEEEILEDLCWPHPPPGRWDLYPANGRPAVGAGLCGRNPNSAGGRRTTAVPLGGPNVSSTAVSA